MKSFVIGLLHSDCDSEGARAQRQCNEVRELRERSFVNDLDFRARQFYEFNSLHFKLVQTRTVGYTLQTEAGTHTHTLSNFRKTEH